MTVNEVDGFVVHKEDGAKHVVWSSKKDFYTQAWQTTSGQYLFTPWILKNINTHLDSTLALHKHVNFKTL